MAMINGSLLKSCKIKIEDIIVVFTDGTTITIPSRNVTYISIEKDFFNSFLPIINIKCVVSKQEYYKINTNSPKFKVNIKKFFLPSTEQVFDKHKLTIVYKQFINDIFVNTNNVDSSPIENSIENRKELKNQDRNDYEKANTELDLYLFTEDGLKYRKLNSTIFKNTNMLGVLLALTQLTEQSNRLLLTLPDNNKIYTNENIIIPTNLTYIGCIKYLQSVYGIYENSYMLFNDFDILYLLDKSMKCNAYSRGEFKRVYIEFNETNKENGNVYGQYNDNNNKRYMLNSINKPIVTTSGTDTSEILFNQLKSTNTFTGKTSVYKIKNLNSTTSNNTKVFDNRYNNDYIVKSMVHEMEINNYSIQVSLNETDMDILTPNKEYYLNFNLDNTEYKKLSGTAILSKIIGIYEKADDEIFNGLIKAEFKRA